MNFGRVVRMAIRYKLTFAASVVSALVVAVFWGANIGAVYRIAPRVLLNEGKLRLAGEVEWTAAAYGTPDERGIVRDEKWLGNLRLLGAVYYFF